MIPNTRTNAVVALSFWSNMTFSTSFVSLVTRIEIRPADFPTANKLAVFMVVDTPARMFAQAAVSDNAAINTPPDTASPRRARRSASNAQARANRIGLE